MPILPTAFGAVPSVRSTRAGPAWPSLSPTRDGGLSLCTERATKPWETFRWRVGNSQLVEAGKMQAQICLGTAKSRLGKRMGHKKGDSLLSATPACAAPSRLFQRQGDLQASALRCPPGGFPPARSRSSRFDLGNTTPGPRLIESLQAPCQKEARAFKPCSSRVSPISEKN